MNGYLNALKPKDRDALQIKTDKIRTLTERTAENIYEIGRELIQVKTLLGHGRFLDWLQAEFEWSERTARNFMAVALKLERPAQNGKICQYAPSALYLLAGGNTPEAARREAEELAEEGQRITFSVAEELKEKHQAADLAFAALTPAEQEEIAGKMTQRLAPAGTDWRAERNRHLRAALAAAKQVTRPTPRDRTIRQRLEQWLVKPKVKAAC